MSSSAIYPDCRNNKSDAASSESDLKLSCGKLSIENIVKEECMNEDQDKLDCIDCHFPSVSPNTLCSADIGPYQKLIEGRRYSMGSTGTQGHEYGKRNDKTTEQKLWKLKTDDEKISGKYACLKKVYVNQGHKAELDADLVKECLRSSQPGKYQQLISNMSKEPSTRSL